VEVVASLSQGRTAAAQCGLFTHKSVPVIFEPPCMFGCYYLTVFRHKTPLTSPIPCPFAALNVVPSFGAEIPLIDSLCSIILSYWWSICIVHHFLLHLRYVSILKKVRQAEPSSPKMQWGEGSQTLQKTALNLEICLHWALLHTEVQWVSLPSWGIHTNYNSSTVVWRRKVASWNSEPVLITSGTIIF